MRTKEELEVRLQQVTDELRKKEARFSPVAGSDVSQYFHLGMVGSGRHTKRLNEKKERALERSIHASKELEPLYREQESLRHLIETFSSRQEQDKERQSRREAALDRLQNVKPGMQVITAFGNAIVVKKVNLRSITSDGGTRYRFEDLIDVAQAS